MQRLHARTSVTSYTSVNIYNFNSHLAHFNALWLEYIRSLWTGIMAEYPVMSTSQGTYVRIEQTSEAIRVTYEIRRAEGARTGIENRCFTLMQIWFLFMCCICPHSPLLSVLILLSRYAFKVHFSKACAAVLSVQIIWSLFVLWPHCSKNLH